jgi:hypothetical protein
MAFKGRFLRISRAILLFSATLFPSQESKSPRKKEKKKKKRKKDRSISPRA